MSELRLVADLAPPVLLGAFGAISLVLIFWSARRRHAGSTAGVLPGIVPALVTGYVIAALNALLTLLVEEAMGLEAEPAEVGLLTFLLIAGATALAVLDVYAIWSPVRPTRAGAAGRALIGLILVGSFAAFFSGIVRDLDSAAVDEAIAADQRAEAARSAGLSMRVAVVDTQLGAVNENGQLVSRLTLDITVRSTTTIQLLPLTEPDFVNQETWIGPADFVSVDLGVLGLPTHMRAGFEETYRVVVPLSADVAAEYYTTGPWAARLKLIGLYDKEGSPITYRTTATFTVPAVP